MLRRLFKPKAKAVEPELVFTRKVDYSAEILAELLKNTSSGLIAVQWDEESIKIFSIMARS